MIKAANLKNLAIFFVIFFLFHILIINDSYSHVRVLLTDRLHGDTQALDNIVIVKIDDRSINKIGRWPWERDVYASVLEKMKDAKVIGIDLSFFEHSDKDESLREILESMDNVILAAEISDGTLYKPIFDTRYGYVNLVTDTDGVTRKVEPRLMEGTRPFAFEMHAFIFGDDHANESYEINFAPLHSFNSVSFIDALGYNFSGKIVFLGASAADLHDNYLVPTSFGEAMDGVEIHANIFQNLLLRNNVTRQSLISVLFVVLTIGSVFMFFVPKLKPEYLITTEVVFFVSYMLFGIFLFQNYNYLIDLFYFPVSMLVFTGAGVWVNYLDEKKHSSYLKDAFGRYISKDLLKQIVEHKHELKLGGTKRVITIFFSDIRGFTSISEVLGAENLVKLLNEYLTSMTKIILKHKGTVDKFIGDAVMAFWNAPMLDEEHARHACESAIEQINELRQINKRFKEQGLPEINIGIGIHTGLAIIGNTGSEDRFDYTALGDTINLGSRLEGLTKQYGVNIIISEETFKVVKDCGFLCRKLDKVAVKGKKVPIVIYELCVDNDAEFAKEFEKALGMYFDLKFKEALDMFEKLHKKYKNPSCETFLKRCEEFMRSPPDKGWDGTFEMKSK